MKQLIPSSKMMLLKDGRSRQRSTNFLGFQHTLLMLKLLSMYLANCIAIVLLPVDVLPVIKHTKSSLSSVTFFFIMSMFDFRYPSKYIFVPSGVYVTTIFFLFLQYCVFWVVFEFEHHVVHYAVCSYCFFVFGYCFVCLAVRVVCCGGVVIVFIKCRSFFYC